MTDDGECARVLLVAGDASERVATALAAAADLAVETVAGADAAGEALADAAADCVVVDAVAGDGAADDDTADSPGRVAERARAAQPGVPVVVVGTADDAEPAARSAGEPGEADDGPAVPDDAVRLPADADGDRIAATVGRVAWRRHARHERERRAELGRRSAAVALVLAADGTVLEASPSAERHLGHAPAALVGDRLFEYAHPGDEDRVVAAFQSTVVEDGHEPTLTWRLAGADGDWRAVETTLAARLDDPAVEGVVCNATDVTERERMVSEAEETLERMTDAFFSLDADWAFTYLNEQAQRVLGRTALDLVGRNVWEAFPAATDRAFYEQYHRAMDTQETVSFVEYYPPLSTWFAVTAYPSETGLSVYFADVTERRERERELDWRTERAAAVGRALASEVKPALTAARSGLAATRDDRSGTAGRLDDPGEVLAGVADTVDALAAVTSRDARRLDSEPVAIGSVAREAWHHVDAPDATLAVAEDLPHVEADPDRLQHALERLLAALVDRGGTDLGVDPLPDGFALAAPGATTDAELLSLDAARAGGPGTVDPWVARRVVERHGWSCTVRSGDDARVEVRGLRDGDDAASGE